MNQANNLRLEQVLKLSVYKHQLTNLSDEYSKVYLIKTLEYILIKDNFIRFLMRKNQLL